MFYAIYLRTCVSIPLVDWIVQRRRGWVGICYAISGYLRLFSGIVFGFASLVSCFEAGLRGMRVGSPVYCIVIIEGRVYLAVWNCSVTSIVSIYTIVLGLCCTRSHFKTVPLLLFTLTTCAQRFY